MNDELETDRELKAAILKGFYNESGDFDPTVAIEALRRIGALNEEQPSQADALIIALSDHMRWLRANDLGAQLSESDARAIIQQLRPLAAVVTPETTPEDLRSLASWWAGWCTDHDRTLPELAKLGEVLLDLKHALDGATETTEPTDELMQKVINEIRFLPAYGRPGETYLERDITREDVYEAVRCAFGKPSQQIEAPPRPLRAGRVSGVPANRKDN